ncbi:MAG: polyphenol oxidase family protein, partial [Spirochaetaceae bacterium]|nr:polyphenol oxidase family protein [Spirochaetaceae bacterium]
GDMRRDGEGRGRFYRLVGVDPERVHVVGQVHSRRVVVVRAEVGDGRRTAIGEHFTPDADGLITDDANAVLGVTVADCMPIYLYDTATGARGLLHSGWRGTGILGTAIGMLQVQFGSRAEDLVVTMGPCISAASYEVDEARAAEFAAEWGEDAVRRVAGGSCLDLRAANEEICRRNGVDLINVINHCTVRESSLGSYRREGPDRYTLMLALLGGTLQLGDR